MFGNRIHGYRNLKRMAVDNGMVKRLCNEEEVGYVDLWDSFVVTLLPCAVESHPTPGDIRGSSSPSRSISGVSSHVADGGSARVPHECVQPSLSWSSSPSRPIHSPEHHVIFHPSCSHHPK